MGAAYFRISEDREGQAYGIDRQRDEVRALAARLGITIVEEYVENDTGASTRSKKQRPEYARMLSDLDAGRFTTILAYSMSRLTRRPREGEPLIERAEAGRLTIRTVASGDPDLQRADGRATFRTLMAWDAAEAERIAERVAAAARQRATRGGYGGGARRFGYTADASALVPEEAEALEFAYRLVAAGGTLEAVVRDWRDRGLAGAQGGRITGVQVRDTLLRAMNAGLSVYRGEIVGRTKGIPTVIDEDTYMVVRETLLDPARRTTVGQPTKTLLAGVLRCTTCGQRLYGSTRTSGGSSDRVPIYACRARCVSRRRERLDEAVSGLVLAYLQVNAGRLSKPVPGRPTAALDEVEALRARLERLARLAADGTLHPDDFAMAAGALRTSLADAERRVVADAHMTATVALVDAGDVLARWQVLEVDERRAVIRELIDHIAVGRGQGGRFSMDSVQVVWRDSPGQDAG